MKRRILVICFILCFWQLAHLLIQARYFPSVPEVFTAMVSEAAELLLHVGVSLYRIGVAIILSLALGIPLGVMLAMLPQVDKVVSPLIYALYPVPKIAFLPLILLFFGLGNGSKILLIMLILIFQIVVSVRDSAKTIHQSYHLSIKALGATPLQVVAHMVMPAIVPNLLSALRVSIGTAIAVLFFAENYATRYGIGFYIMDSWLKLAYAQMFGGVVAIALMGTSLFACIDLLEKRYCRWLH